MGSIRSVLGDIFSRVAPALLQINSNYPLVVAESTTRPQLLASTIWSSHISHSTDAYYTVFIYFFQLFSLSRFAFWLRSRHLCGARVHRHTQRREVEGANPKRWCIYFSIIIFIKYSSIYFAFFSTFNSVLDSDFFFRRCCSTFDLHPSSVFVGACASRDFFRLFAMQLFVWSACECACVCVPAVGSERVEILLCWEKRATSVWFAALRVAESCAKKKCMDEIHQFNIRQTVWYARGFAGINFIISSIIQFTYASLAIWHMRYPIWYRFSYRKIEPIRVESRLKSRTTRPVIGWSEPCLLFCSPSIFRTDRNGGQITHALTDLHTIRRANTKEIVLFYVLRHVSMLTRSECTCVFLIDDWMKLNERTLAGRCVAPYHSPDSPNLNASRNETDGDGGCCVNAQRFERFLVVCDEKKIQAKKLNLLGVRHCFVSFH